MARKRKEPTIFDLLHQIVDALELTMRGRSMLYDAINQLTTDTNKQEVIRRKNNESNRHNQRKRSR